MRASGSSVQSCHVGKFNSQVCIHNAHAIHYEHCSMMILCSRANVLCPIASFSYSSPAMRGVSNVIFRIRRDLSFIYVWKTDLGPVFSLVFKHNFSHAVSLLILSNNAIY